MTDPTKSLFNVSETDLRDVGWQELLSSEPSKTCSSYRRVFGKAGTECRELGDDVGDRVYSFLHTIASFCPRYTSGSLHYGPMVSWADGNRSLIPDDFEDEQFRVLSEIVSEIQDAEFRARVADILWTCRKDFKSAILAIESFVESAENLKTPELWPPFVERIDRAAQISAKKGFERQKEKVCRFIEEAIAEFKDDTDTGLLCCQLMFILLAVESGTPEKYASLSEELANMHSTLDDWHSAKLYWERASDWFRRAKDEVNFKRCQIAEAECDISRAHQGAKQDSPQMGYAAHWMGQGLEGLRRAKADPSRIQEIHKELLEFQKESLKEMEAFGIEEAQIPGLKEEREEIQQAASDHVKGIGFEQAVVRLALVGDPTNPEALRKRLEKNSENFIWDKIMSQTAIDRDGKVADKMEPIGFDESDENQVALRKKLVQLAMEIDWKVSVEWQIEPARMTIIDEHSIRPLDLHFLVRNNPFIPSGHEGIYLRGIHAGFFGDWLLSSHLLIPQIEASLRYVLQQHGEITSTLESSGMQKERDINQLLWLKKTEEIFGPEILFDLRGILIERFGSNMRNESAHGLMSEASFYRQESVYLWWLVIRLCWTGITLAPPEGELF